MVQSMQSTPIPDVEVYQIHAGDGDGADIIFNYGDRRISVSMFQNPTAAGSVEDRLIALCGHAVSCDSDEYEDIVDEIWEVIINAGKDAFDKITQPGPTLYASQSLHSVLYPQTFTFCLRTASDELSVVAIDPEDAYTAIEEGPNDDFDADLDIDSTLPVYPSDQIIILDSLLRGGGSAVGRVVLQGDEMLCKAQARGLRDSRLARELAAHHKIQAAASADTTVSVRVPRLLGYISHAQNSSTIGLLREWIPGRILRDLDMATIPAATRGKWASQIHETVKQLHDIGVVWGDGKPSNIVIDKQQNAWLIDFGGGWTEGWVDEELADSVEGDDQALVRIVEFLGISRQWPTA